MYVVAAAVVFPTATIITISEATSRLLRFTLYLPITVSSIPISSTDIVSVFSMETVLPHAEYFSPYRFCMSFGDPSILLLFVRHISPFDRISRTYRRSFAKSTATNNRAASARDDACSVVLFATYWPYLQTMKSYLSVCRANSEVPRRPLRNADNINRRNAVFAFPIAICIRLAQSIRITK